MNEQRDPHQRGRRSDEGPSDEDWERLARVVARLLAGSWDREQAALEAARREQQAG